MVNSTSPGTIHRDFDVGCWEDMVYGSVHTYTEQEISTMQQKLVIMAAATTFPAENALIPDQRTFDLIKAFSVFGLKFLNATLCSFETTGKYTFDYIKQWIEPLVDTYYITILD